MSRMETWKLQMSWKWLIVEWKGVQFGTQGYEYEYLLLSPTVDSWIITVGLRVQNNKCL